MFCPLPETGEGNDAELFHGTTSEPRHPGRAGSCGVARLLSAPWLEGVIGEQRQVAFFQCGGLVFALWTRDALAEDAGVERAGKGFANISLAQNVRSKEDVDAMLAEAKKAGATILKPGTEAPWGGYTGYFADPDGFALGGRLEPRVRDPAGRRHQAAGIEETPALPNVFAAITAQLLRRNVQWPTARNKFMMSGRWGATD